IRTSLQRLIDEGKYEEALSLVDEKINIAILDFEKRKTSVKKILQTKLSLSFNESDKGLISEWENAIIDAISKMEMLGSTFIQQINQKITERVRIPAIEKFLLEAAKRKAFMRMTFDFVAKRLNVPREKVEEVVEDLIFDGKLAATIDQVTGTIIFADVAPSTVFTPPAPSSTEAPISPAPKPSPISPLPPKETITPSKEATMPISEGPQPIDVETPIPEGPQPIDLDTPVPEEPQPIDVTLEPPDLTEELLETPPPDLEIPPEIGADKEKPVDSQAASEIPPPTVPEAPSATSETPVPSESLPPTMSEEEKEARSIISFFKSTVEELTEKEREELRRKREEKRKKLLEAKKRKQEEAKKESKKVKEDIVESIKKDTAPLGKDEAKHPAFRPAGDIQKKIDVIDKGSPSEPLTPKLIIPPESKSSSENEIQPIEKKTSESTDLITCVICKKEVVKDDPTVIACPHACGAYGHKEEFLKIGKCPKCNEKISEVDIEFSELL
ncbi:MAG: PCI domain-containing protein, partial [Candidatus Helarchaeota archaeon]